MGVEKILHNRHVSLLCTARQVILVHRHIFETAQKSCNVAKMKVISLLQKRRRI